MVPGEAKLQVLYVACFVESIKLIIPMHMYALLLKCMCVYVYERVIICAQGLFC